METVEHRCPVRIDLVGGTLDIAPINLILEHACVINFAISLYAKVKIEKYVENKCLLTSTDYNLSFDFDLAKISQWVNNPPEELTKLSWCFLILNEFPLDTKEGLAIHLESDAPASSGLGGSSAMAMSLWMALEKLTGKKFDIQNRTRRVQAIEAKILNSGPTGYQDYIPAQVGGVLALSPDWEKIKIEQLYTPELAQFIEGHVTLVYSGQTHHSGMSNWEVYKGFFDHDANISSGLKQIDQYSFKGYQHLKEENYKSFLEQLGLEGSVRTNLFPGIVTGKMKEVFSALKKIDSTLDFKVCGAGGGGCFLITHPNELSQQALKVLDDASMDLLDYRVLRPFS